jgi:hypothetical protein
MKATPRMIVLACALASSSAWAGTAQITGTIVDEATRLPLAGMCAEAYGSAPPNEFTSAPTGSDGTYTISGLDPDAFQVIAFDCTPPVDHALVEYKQRHRSLHGAHNSLLGARLVRLRKEAQVKRNVDLNMPVAGHIDVTVVHDATGLPASGVLVIPLSIPQPRRGSFVTSGSDGSSDDGGHVTLDVDPGGSTLYALPPFANAGEFIVGPAVTVDSGAVEPAEIRVP